MRPSGRKASLQGNLKVATVVMVKGKSASGFCSPTLTWAQAATDAIVKSTAAFANFIDIHGLRTGFGSRGADLISSNTCWDEIALPRTIFITVLQTVLYTRQISRMQDSEPRARPCRRHENGPWLEIESPRGGLAPPPKK